MLSAEDTLVLAYYGIIKEFGWRRVALLVQNEDLFTVVYKLDTANLVVKTSPTTHSTPCHEYAPYIIHTCNPLAVMDMPQLTPPTTYNPLVVMDMSH